MKYRTPADMSAAASWIISLRQAAGLNQAELASVLGVSAMAVSRWERGINAELYIALGKLALDYGVNCWWFWDRAGLARKDALRT